jgi:hypothetical protein
LKAWIADLVEWQAEVDQLHVASSRSAIAKFVQTSPPADIQRRGLVHFSGLVDWLGYSRGPLDFGKSQLTVFLHLIKALPDGYHLALVLRNDISPPRIRDERPVDGLYPYYRWKPGEYIANPYRIMAVEMDMLPKACLELLDDRNRPVEAQTQSGERFDCAPLSEMDDTPAKGATTAL